MTLLLLTLTVHAQQPQPAPAGRQTQQEPARPYEPGMLESVGRWFRGAYDRMRAGVEDAGGTLDRMRQSAGGAAKDAAGVAKDAAGKAGVVAKDAAKGAADAAQGAAEAAADTISRLPQMRIFEGRERCALAPNGAPDCRAAADAVCRRNGFGSGSSIDIQSAQKCPAQLWLSGRTPQPGECAVESYVIRAACQ